MTASFVPCWSMNWKSIQRAWGKSCIMTARRSVRGLSPTKSPARIPSAHSGRVEKAMLWLFSVSRNCIIPDLQKNSLGYTRRDDEGAISTRAQDCGHDFISAAIVPRPLRTGIAAAPYRKAVGHRMLIEDPDVFLGSVSRVQFGPWADAVGGDRGQPCQPRPDLSRCVGRWRQRRRSALGQFAHSIRRGVNMLYIVENNGVYGLTKGQFSATLDTGAEVQARRREQRRADRPRRDGAAARRYLCGAQLLGRQGAVGAADRGRAEA